VQWFAGKSEVRFAHCFVLCRVCVDEGRDICGMGFPVHDQLSLADLLTDA
jgi:hypothetical protein